MSVQRRTNRQFDPTPPPGTTERRTVCRYAVILSDSWLGWWEGPNFQNTPAKIIDISLRGAFLTVDAFPPKGQQSLWFCPPGVTAQEEWIEVKLVSFKKRLFGPREVRIAFRKVFPYDLFKTVVYGSESSHYTPPPTWVPEESDERDWW